MRAGQGAGGSTDCACCALQTRLLCHETGGDLPGGRPSLLEGPIFRLSGRRWRTQNLVPQVTRVGPRAGAGWVANAFWVRMTPCAFAQNCSNARALNHCSGRVSGSLTA